VYNVGANITPNEQRIAIKQKLSTSAEKYKY
jgi:hypothetical protein